LSALGIVSMLASPSAVLSQTYPDHPLKIIAPIAAGGLTDILTREIASGLSERLGQPVIVENRPGGGGTIGMVAAAKSPPDGYTLVMVYGGVASVNPVLIPGLPYDTVRDFTPISLVGSFPLLLIARRDFPARDTRELIALVKSKPGIYNYGSAGNATTSHMTMELFRHATGLEITHVPYKGEAPALADILGGQIDFAFSSMTSVMPYLGSDRLRVLGISTPAPSDLAPGVVPVAESGIPGFNATGWYAVLAPKDTPTAIIARLNETIGKIVTDPQVRAKMASQGVELFASTPEGAARWIADDAQKSRTVIEKAGIKAN
jgi:tripartite-type tricarboxylate transporter receptor subunit TctC